MIVTHEHDYGKQGGATIVSISNLDHRIIFFYDEMSARASGQQQFCAKIYYRALLRELFSDDVEANRRLYQAGQI